MKAYPLIYSRILQDDYPSGFLVRPGDLDFSAASKYVIPAVEDVKYAGGIRHAVFPVGIYLIYGGVACIAGELVKRIAKSRNIDFPYEEYQADKAGRPLAFFVGFAVRKNELFRGELPDIDLYDTYKIYLGHLAKQWRKDRAETEISDGIELKTRRYTPGAVPQSLEAGGKRILRNYREDGFQEVVNYYFANMAWGHGGDFSFLSNVLPDEAAKVPFGNISVYGCSPEECVRMMRSSGAFASGLSTPYTPPMGRAGSEVHTYNPLDSQVTVASDDGFDAQAESFHTEKKKNGRPGGSVNPLTVGIGVLLIAAIIALLLVLSSKGTRKEQERKKNDAAWQETAWIDQYSAVLEELETRFLESTSPQAEEKAETSDTAPLEDIESRI